MKKILFVISSLSGGGAEKTLITYLRCFDYKRYKVDLCLVNKVGVYLEDVPKEVRLIPLYNDLSSMRTKLEYNLYSRFGLGFLERMRIRKSVDKNYDAIISFCEGRSLKFHSYITDYTKNNITWVHTDMHNNHHSVGKIFSARHELQAYGKMQTVVCVSENAKRQFDKEFPCIKVPKKVIVNPILKDAIVAYRDTDVVKGSFILSGVGRLSTEKAFDRTVRLAVYLKKKGYKFHINIIGDGPCREELNTLINKNDVEDCVSLLGFINPPYRELSCSDIFLNMSKVEAYPLVICEAMCLGIPVIATKTAGSVELLGGDKYGLLVEQNDESIFEGVERFMNDDRLRNHYHEKALERADSFDVKTVMTEVYSLIG